MTKYQFFKALGYVDEEIVEEANNSSAPRKRRRVSPLAVACALITALSLASGIIMYSVNVHRQKLVKEETVNMIVNEIEPITYKLRGTYEYDLSYMTKVSDGYARVNLAKQIEVDFLKKFEKKYFVSVDEKYLKIPEYKMPVKPLSFGVKFKLAGGEKIEMIIVDNSNGSHYKVLKKYRNLSKSKVGDYDVIVCKEVKSNWGVIICGSGQYDYCFEVSREYTKDELVAVLKEILE